MIDFVYSILFKLSKIGMGDTLFFKLLRKFSKLIINCIYPLYIKIIPKKGVGINTESKENIIISLTSFPARINHLWICVETLLRQKTKPNQIILWLAESQFSGLESLPKKLLLQQKRGLTIRFCEDLKSHKKYFFAMKEFPNSNIIIVDDDMFYPTSLVEELLTTSKRYPGVICCTRGHYIQYRETEIRPYSEWRRKSDINTPSFELCPTGCGGVLYPPQSLNENVFNKDDIKELCLNADDLWLKIMSLINTTKAIKTDPNMIGFIDIIQTQKVKLTSSNVGQNMNDKQLSNILSKYSAQIILQEDKL